MKQNFDSKEEALNRDNVYYWMNKYISLLEKYNELLVQQSFKEAGESDKNEEKPEPTTPLKKTK
jgi:hypothetical protein